MELSEGTVTLGLDLGPNSIGWALIEETGGTGGRIIDVGVRVFQAGLDDLTQDGRGKSRNAARREARQRRRMLERHARRLRNLAKLLQRSGLLPDGDVENSDGRHDMLNELDRTIDSPYQLRARALDQRLEPFELGRVFYHMAQRRGFLSNRKAEPKDDEEKKGKVKEAISGLAANIDQAGARTLGEYFAGIDPREERIRSRYTSRQMYQEEFEKIWIAQTEHHPDLLTEELRDKLYRVIFHQRPLKSQTHLIGECQLEPGRKRAPWALLQAQRFRYLQTVNNLEVHSDLGERRALEPEERKVLCEKLELQEKMTFGRARQVLKLSKKSKFNLEAGGEKHLIGNKTAARLSAIFGKERWTSMRPAEQQAVVEDWRSIIRDETLRRRGRARWSLADEQADKFSRLNLDEGYCAFSRQALEKLIPELEKGKHLATAIREQYPDRWEHRTKPLDLLPAFDDSGLPELRNPIIRRCLTELRRVVNAIIKKYGKPHRIRIELARDIRQTAKQRENTTKRMRANEKARKRAAREIASELGYENPSRQDVEKILLWYECNRECPYTGKSIPIGALFGPHPQFDVEHIIPFDRSMDNSFLNKTLCDAEENRKSKRNRTPHEAYHSNPKKWAEITARVRRFSGDAAREKLRRFRLTQEEVEVALSDFTSRQLNDTRWAARAAKKYLGLLYGGVNDDGVDDSGKRRVQASAGQVTADLRRLWGLNGILGGEEKKSRDDHRHHAVDAVVVALTRADMIAHLTKAAQEAAASGGSRLYESIPLPWQRFRHEVERHILDCVTSHRVSRRVRGPLHRETFYSRPRKDEEGNSYVVTRKHLSTLSAKDLSNILDGRVREAVMAKLSELGGEPSKAFSEDSSHPVLKRGDGKKIPIHRVRVRQNLTELIAVGTPDCPRYVQSEAIHHMEIVEVNDPNGKTRWEGHVVSMYEAYRRKRNGSPIIKRDHGPGKRFLFSIAGGDTIELGNSSDSRELFIVRTVPQSKQIRFVPINDARKLADIPKTGNTAYPETLRSRSCTKAIVTPIGQLRRAST
jgi:CRISPR-associated endonuclease Csn1